MGVKELWSILAPVKKQVSLDTLKDQTIAVDLSVWICENQGVKAVQGKVSKPHLRNLFFRISNLIQLGITVVFVVDGDPPELKWETISSRINSRYRGRGRGSSKNNKNGKPGRSHFKSQIKECLDLLDCLGVPYVQSTGEAEALCALLNQEGIVDGCITEDGDVFLYGATTVYKNFNLTGKSPVIDCYNMADIERQLGLTRKTLVALALLLGCDYVPKGVPGVGKVHALQLVSQYRGSNILERFKRWADRDVEFQLSLPTKPAHCTRCHHIGSAQKHKTGGCPLCGRSLSCASVKKGSPCTCDWHRRKQEFDKCAPERDIMLKAMQVPGFPQENVIEEFLNVKDKCPQHPLKFERPKMIKIMKFALDKLDWPEKYTREKVIDLVVFHDLQNFKEEKTSSENLDVDTIVKRRIKNGVPCVEVLWKLPDAWKLEDDESDVISTIENFDLFKSVFPDVVEEFESIEASKKDNKKGKKKKTTLTQPSGDRDVLETVTDQLSGLMLQTRDAKESDHASSQSVHTMAKISGDQSCDTSHSPKRMDDDSSVKGLCLQNETVKEDTCSSFLSHCSSSQHDLVLSEDEMFLRERELDSAEGTNVVQGRENTPNSECNHQRKDEGDQCSILSCTSNYVDEVSHRVYQPCDDSSVPSLAERLNLKRRQKICGRTDRDNLEGRRNESSRAQPTKDFGSKYHSETGGSNGKGCWKRTVDLNKCKDQGKYERALGYMEQTSSLVERSNRSDNEIMQNLNLKQEGKDLEQRTENIKLRGWPKVVPVDYVTHASGLTSSSTTMCPELFDITTPDLSLVDATSVGTITQSSIDQSKISKNGQEMSSVCPEVHDVATPNVSLLEKDEPSGNRDSQKDRLIDSTEVEGYLQVGEEVYDLCTPDVSLVNINEERQELECVSTIRLTDESEKGNSPVCSGSFDVIRAAKFALRVDNERDSKFEGFGQEGSVPLEPTELYDLCTPDVSTVGDQARDEVMCQEDGAQDVIEILDEDDDMHQKNGGSCIQDGCNDLAELHVNDGYPQEEDGGCREGEGGQQVMSTPESSLWEEPTTLNINTPSQTLVSGTPSTNAREDFSNREIETWRHDGSHELQDSYQIGNQYSCSQLSGASNSETLTGEEKFCSVLRDNGGYSPSTGLNGSTLQEKSMDHSLFQNLNFSLGTSEWTFSPMTERPGTGKCGQFNESKMFVATDRKHLNKSSCQSRKFEDVGVHKYAYGNETTKSRVKESNPKLREVKEDGGKLQDETDKKETEDSLRKMVDSRVLTGYEQLLVDQPLAVKFMCTETGQKISSRASVTSIESTRCEGMMGRGQGKGRGLSYEDYRERVLMERSNQGVKNVNTKRHNKVKQKESDRIGKDGLSWFGSESLTCQELTKECINHQSCAMVSDTKVQRNCNDYGREIETFDDKENSPVSLMDRLRKKSSRTRDILESMELD